MPQMSPLDWFMLMNYFLLIYIFMFLLVYYLFKLKFYSYGFLLKLNCLKLKWY